MIIVLMGMLGSGRRVAILRRPFMSAIYRRTMTCRLIECWRRWLVGVTSIPEMLYGSAITGAGRSASHGDESAPWRVSAGRSLVHGPRRAMRVMRSHACHASIRPWVAIHGTTTLHLSCDGRQSGRGGGSVSAVGILARLLLIASRSMVMIV